MSNTSLKSTVFIIKNQQGLYLSKQQEWVDGSDSHVLYRTRHRDEAINTVFEVSSRDIYLRAETVLCNLDTRGQPILATVEPVTPAKAAQIARLQDDLEDEPAPAAEEPNEAHGVETETAESPDAAPGTPEATDPAAADSE